MEKSMLFKRAFSTTIPHMTLRRESCQNLELPCSLLGGAFELQVLAVANESSVDLFDINSLECIEYGFRVGRDSCTLNSTSSISLLSELDSMSTEEQEGDDSVPVATSVQFANHCLLIGTSRGELLEVDISRRNVTGFICVSRHQGWIGENRTISHISCLSDYIESGRGILTAPSSNSSEFFSFRLKNGSVHFQPIPGHKDTVVTCAIGPDDYIATASVDGHIRVWKSLPAIPLDSAFQYECISDIEASTFATAIQIIDFGRRKSGSKRPQLGIMASLSDYSIAVFGAWRGSLLAKYGANSHPTLSVVSPWSCFAKCEVPKSWAQKLAEFVTKESIELPFEFDDITLGFAAQGRTGVFGVYPFKNLGILTDPHECVPSSDRVAKLSGQEVIGNSIRGIFRAKQFGGTWADRDSMQIVILTEEGLNFMTLLPEVLKGKESQRNTSKEPVILSTATYSPPLSLEKVSDSQPLVIRMGLHEPATIYEYHENEGEGEENLRAGERAAALTARVKALEVDMNRAGAALNEFCKAMQLGFSMLEEQVKEISSRSLE